MSIGLMVAIPASSLSNPAQAFNESRYFMWNLEIALADLHAKMAACGGTHAWDAQARWHAACRVAYLAKSEGDGRLQAILDRTTRVPGYRHEDAYSTVADSAARWWQVARRVERLARSTTGLRVL